MALQIFSLVGNIQILYHIVYYNSDILQYSKLKLNRFRLLLYFIP